MSVVREMTVDAYLEALGAGSAVPGGGSAAALAGAMGAALVGMVARISARKAATDSERQALLAALPELEALRGQLADLSQRDVDAYRGVIDARRQQAGDAALQRAFEEAARVPLETAHLVARTQRLATGVAAHAWSMTASDLDAGRGLLQTALRAALANVAANLPDLRGAVKAEIARAYQELSAGL